MVATQLEPAAAKDRVESATEPGPGATPDYRARILIVDDDERNL